MKTEPFASNSLPADTTPASHTTPSEGATTASESEATKRAPGRSLRVKSSCRFVYWSSGHSASARSISYFLANDLSSIVRNGRGKVRLAPHPTISDRVF